MTQVELDSLSDEELQRYIDGVDEDRDARPSREQAAGGARGGCPSSCSCAARSACGRR